MITKLSVRNFLTFDEEVVIDFKSDMRTHRFNSNTIEKPDGNYAKTLGIYGPNNTGKTTVIRAIHAIQSLMLGNKIIDCANAFTNNKVTDFKVEYYVGNKKYRYELSYNSKTNEYLVEKLFLINHFPSNKNMGNETLIIEKDLNTKTYKYLNRSKGIINFSSSFPIVMILSDDSNKSFIDIKNDYTSFSKSFIVIRFDAPILINKTMSLLQNDEKATHFITEFVKNCDLSIQDFGYSNEVKSDIDISSKIDSSFFPDGKLSPVLKLWSKHKGFVIPSALFDSSGTQKIVALAGFIYDALANDKILVIDELSDGLHHIISRAIVSMFNNELNKGSQLIFTTHDLLLLDTKKLMRKDQIYLTDIKDNQHAQLCCLTEFTSAEDKIRGTENICDYYLKGRFGAVPSPSLFECLSEISSARKAH